MGAGGVPNRTIERVDGKRKRGDLPISGAKPNSRYDLYLEGKKIQSRWFDSNGNVVRNRDFEHQDAHNTHYFPHDHTWEWINNKTIRDKNLTQPDYDSFK